MRTIVPISVVLVFLGVAIFSQKRPTDKAVEFREPAHQTVYQQICQQCHGAKGEGKIELETPSIAGQPEWYLTTQLEKFRLGQRGTDERDIAGQQMRAISLSLTEAQIDEATQEIVSFPRLPTEPTLEGDLANGRLIYEEECIDCHRYNGSGERVFGSSPLTSFQDWYIAAQIDKFRQGMRGYHPDDEKGMQMRHLTSYLREIDVRDVSAYIATLAQRYPPDRRKR